VDAVVPRAELRDSLARLLRLLPVPPAEDQPLEPGYRAWRPISAISGLAERVGGAVSETIGIEVEAPDERSGNGAGQPRSADHPRKERP
jgi:hypothetical protein